MTPTNRSQRRRRVKNRDATKKGMAKVIKLNGNEPPTAHYVPAGGKVHQQALKNSRNFRAQARGK